MVLYFPSALREAKQRSRQFCAGCCQTLTLTFSLDKNVDIEQRERTGSCSDQEPWPPSDRSSSTGASMRFGVMIQFKNISTGVISN